MVFMNSLQTSNKQLMIELSKLDLKTGEGLLRREEIAAELEKNNQDMKAFAAALGTNDDQPRLVKYRKVHG